MGKQLCIHGHFYQPPREDPWLMEYLPEGSAAPMTHWNERIAHESYAPMGWARRCDENGWVTDIINNYEWISFNFGPTLLSWMERCASTTYARILEGDAKSEKRLGHGNAIAQNYHHIIMPLASQLDKEVETMWALADFKTRFKRPAQGMWLAEAAVDVNSLEVLAAHDVKFTILAPRQAKAVAELDSDEWRPVHEGCLDIHVPYTVQLPSGREIAVFFYNGPVSLAIAFEGLLHDGERFWRHISDYFNHGGHRSGANLLSLATDGETYGHHHQFGEMALAYVLAQASFHRDEVELTNFAAHLATQPPKMKVQIHEPSSWSCAHGVERWRSDCGCTNGGGGDGWNQKWRAPLRNGLNALKSKFDKHFFAAGAEVFKDPRQALLEYGWLLSGAMDEDLFAKHYFKSRLKKEQKRTAWALLDMQQWALSSFASCAWFFDDIYRIEPMNGMTFATKAMELCEKSGGPKFKSLEKGFLKELGQAQANFPGKGTGRDIYLTEVLPKRESPASITLQTVLKRYAAAPGGLPQDGVISWPGVSARLTVDSEAVEGGAIAGNIHITWGYDLEEESFEWRLDQAGVKNPFAWRVDVKPVGAKGKKGAGFAVAEALPWNKRQDIALAFSKAAQERNWRQQVTDMHPAAHMFLPWQEGQSTQNMIGTWVQGWQALAWWYVLGEDFGGVTQKGRTRDAMLPFLKECKQNDCVSLELPERLVNFLLPLLEHKQPPWSKLCKTVERILELELDVDWRPFVNKLWEHDLSKAGPGALAALLKVKQ